VKKRRLKPVVAQTIDMYGWRCQIGLITPLDNAIIEPELYSVVPDGVTINTVRLDTVELDEMPKNAEIKSKDLASIGIDVLAYACNASSFDGGAGHDTKINERLVKASGIPATTASTAMVKALKEIGAESVATVTPYGEESNKRLVSFLEENGIAVNALSGLGLAPDETEDLTVTNSQTATDTYQRVLQINDANVDAVLVTATNLASLETISEMETDVGKPVVSTNQALLWHALSLGGVDPTVPGCGSLLS
jgi:maleate cis-trans isomerase